MLAAWYEKTGTASVLQVGDLPDPTPGPGEVRVRLTYSGVNPGDIAKRRGAMGARMPFPRVVPHSDGAGTVDEVGVGVDKQRIGERVWVYGAQTNRPFGTAAQFTVVPTEMAVAAPKAISDQAGACLGVPGITAYHAVTADGPVEGQVVLVQGIRGAVALMAAQIAASIGAQVIGTVPTQPHTDDRWPVLALDDNPADAVRAHAIGGVDRIIEVAFSANIALDAEVAGDNCVIVTYNTFEADTSLPFWPLLLRNVVLRMLGSNTLAPDVKRKAAAELTILAANGKLETPVAQTFDLDRVAEAHDLVESGRPGGRVLVRIP